jgi:hydrogenase maturation protease
VTSALDAGLLADLVTRDEALLVGVGHPLCGDDAVGSLVVARLAERFPERALDAGPVPESYFGPLTAVPGRPVVFVDAVRLSAPPGTWCLARWADLGHRAPDSHRASLRLLAEVLAAEGIESWVLGIVPAQLELGAPLSPPVARAADDLVALLTAALAETPVHA